MDFHILGPLVVSGIPDAPPLRQAKPRAVLAMLVLGALEMLRRRNERMRGLSPA